MGFTSNGWSVVNGRVIIPEKFDIKTVYKFFNEAIYDSHVPVPRVIGYHIHTTGVSVSSRDNRVLERDTSCAEDRFTIASNLSKLLPLFYYELPIHTSTNKGLFTKENTDIIHSRKKIDYLLSADHIVMSLSDIYLSMIISIDTGYVDPDKNFSKIRRIKQGSSATRYFTVYSYHNLLDFVNIKPFDGSSVQFVYRNGMTDAIMLQILEHMWELKADKEWLSKYKEVIA